MKKALLLALSFILVAAISITGTMAYLTDTDSNVNVMTSGNVQIELIEQQRNEDGTALEDFQQGKTMLPIVGSAQGEKDLFGMPTASNYVDKIINIKNTGVNDAWVRVLVAFPTALDADTADAMAMHWNQGNRFSYEGKYLENPVSVSEWTGAQPHSNVEIDGATYNIYSFTYNTPLAAGEMPSHPAIIGFYLDSRIDYDADKGVYTMNGVEIEGFDGTVFVPVYAQAIQADGFSTSEEAFVNMTTNPWGENFAVPAVVSSTEELAEAAANGGTIYLTEGAYELPANLANVNLIGNGDVSVVAPAVDANSIVALGDNVTVSGINFTVDEEGSNADTAVLLVSGENVTVENCTFDITGTNYSAIAIGGGTDNVVIQGCTFTGGYKHIAPASGTPGDVTIDGCTFDGAKSTYAIHLNCTTNDLTVKNSKIALFSTIFGHGGDAGKLVFENCDFVYVSGKTNVVKLYRSAEFIDCDFEDGFLFSDCEATRTDLNMVFTGGSWGDGTIKDHFMADSFGNSMTVTFDGDVWYWNTDTNVWEDK